jgi:hypothetical protein
MREKPNLASACACQKASNSYSDQVEKYVVAQEQAIIDKTYNDSVLGPATDAWTNKTGVYSNWATILRNLSNEERLFKNCQAGVGYTNDQWAYTCVKDYGTGWQYVQGGDANFGCWPSTKGKCKRTANQINIDMNAQGYSLWKPPAKSTIIPPAAPASTPITCCSQSFENISAGAGINFSGISQSCTTEIKNQIKEALEPPPPPPPAPPPTSSSTSTPSSSSTPSPSSSSTPSPSSSSTPPPSQPPPSQEADMTGVIVAGVISGIIAVSVMVYFFNKNQAKKTLSVANASYSRI